MKQLLLLLLIVNAPSLKAQTGLIAHKSHSGFSTEYDPSMLSNFGETPEMHQQYLNPKNFVKNEEFKRLNDTTIIYSRLNKEDSVILTDTFNHQKNTPDSVLKSNYSLLKKDLSEPIPSIQPSKKKKNRKGSILWISIFASVGFIISKAFLDKNNQSKTI